MSGSVLTLSEALAILGLHGPSDPTAVARAFRIAVKGARPDMPGGDDARFRRIIAAYRLIQSSGGAHAALAAPTQRPAALPVVGLTPLQALAGADTEVRLGDRCLRVRAPAGVRTGEHLRLHAAAVDGADVYLPVLIRPADGLAALGDDLFMRWNAPPRLLEDGGRIEIQTHAGPRSAWVTAGLIQPIRLRLRGLGLPARGARRAGHLFITLETEQDAPSAAEHLLARFTRVWTPERLAA